MHWTLDNYAVGKKGAYRIVTVHATGKKNVQLLKKGEGYWDDILQDVKTHAGKCPAADAYDEAPNGWETV